MKKGTSRKVGSAILVDHSVKMKERKKIEKYLDFAREQNDMEHERIMIPIGIGVFRTIPEGMEEIL